MLISYPLSRSSPVFPGTPPLSIEPFQTIGRDGSRSYTVALNTHTGTHVDLPAHFHARGEGAASLAPLLTLAPALCIELPLEGDRPMRLEALPREAEEAEAVLLRTGSHRHRASDPPRYRDRHPWIHPDGARRLAALPRLRAVGLDTLSAASPAHPAEGAETHRILLRPERPIMVLEDLDLSSPQLAGGRWRLHLVPMLMDEVDATPVTALVEPY